MRITLHEGLFIDLNFNNQPCEYGIDFEGTVWCCQDGEVTYRGTFSTVDEHGNCVPLPDFEPDGDELIEAMNIDKYVQMREADFEAACRRHDLD